jgi:hypothetical protein
LNCCNVLAAFDLLKTEINIVKQVKSWYLSALAAALFAGSVALPASALTVVNTKGIILTQSASERASFATTSTSWTNLYTTNITVPAGEEGAYLRARFTAESLCTGGSAGILSYCRVRIVYGNAAGVIAELEPASGNDYAFDSTDNSSETFGSAEGHAMERTSKEALPPGAYQVTVQVSVNTNAAINFLLDNWHFAIELLAR